MSQLNSHEKVSFEFLQFPLVSKCGLIRRMVLEANDADLSLLDLPDVPGGAEAFELVAKFCYGINFEITPETIAMIHCAADHLEMTEDYAVGNLINRTEDYLNKAALTTLPTAVAVLHHAQTLVPASEKTNLISRCVDAVAVLANEAEDWLDEELTDLGVDIFKRLVVAIKHRNPDGYAVGPLLMLYAQKSLRDLVLIFPLFRRAPFPAFLRNNFSRLFLIRGQLFRKSSEGRRRGSIRRPSTRKE